MMTQAKRFVLLAMLASMAACGGAFAGPTWLCSITAAVSADEDGTVGPPDLGSLERPTFLRVDADAREVTLLAPESRRGEVTRIETIREEAGLWIGSGAEEGRAWTLIISAKGHMTMTVSGDGVVWSVFGYALAME